MVQHAAYHQHTPAGLAVFAMAVNRWQSPLPARGGCGLPGVSSWGRDDCGPAWRRPVAGAREAVISSIHVQRFAGVMCSVAGKLCVMAGTMRMFVPWPAPPSGRYPANWRTPFAGVRRVSFCAWAPGVMPRLP